MTPWAEPREEEQVLIPADRGQDADALVRADPGQGEYGSHDRAGGSAQAPEGTGWFETNPYESPVMGFVVGVRL